MVAGGLVVIVVVLFVWWAAIAPRRDRDAAVKRGAAELAAEREQHGAAFAQVQEQRDGARAEVERWEALQSSFELTPVGVVVFDRWTAQLRVRNDGRSAKYSAVLMGWALGGTSERIDVPLPWASGELVEEIPKGQQRVLTLGQAFPGGSPALPFRFPGDDRQHDVTVQVSAGEVALDLVVAFALHGEPVDYDLTLVVRCSFNIGRMEMQARIHPGLAGSP